MNRVHREGFVRVFSGLDPRGGCTYVYTLSHPGGKVTHPLGRIPLTHRSALALSPLSRKSALEICPKGVCYFITRCVIRNMYVRIRTSSRSSYLTYNLPCCVTRPRMNENLAYTSLHSCHAAQGHCCRGNSPPARSRTTSR